MKGPVAISFTNEKLCIKVYQNEPNVKQDKDCGLILEQVCNGDCSH